MKVATFAKRNGEIIFIALFLGVAKYLQVLPQFFSISSLAMPGVYSLAGIAAIFLFYVSKICAVSIGAQVPLVSSYVNIPTLAGIWYFNSRSTRTHAAVMALCALAFVVHPVGGKVGWYALYWVIPVLVSMFCAHSLFFKSLGTVFVMHAVGSVCWIYTSAFVTPAFIVALVPRVLFERVALACVMTLMVRMMTLVKRMFATVYVSYNKNSIVLTGINR